MLLRMQHELHFRKFGSYPILKKLHDNAYVIDLHEELQISTTCILCGDIFYYHPPDAAMVEVLKNSESNSSAEGGNDAEHPMVIQ